MHHTVGKDGQIEIPKAIRDELGLTPGTPVTFSRTGDSIRIRPLRSAADLGGSFSGSGMAARLLEDRRRERD